MTMYRTDAEPERSVSPPESAFGIDSGVVRNVDPVAEAEKLPAVADAWNRFEEAKRAYHRHFGRHEDDRPGVPIPYAAQAALRPDPEHREGPGTVIDESTYDDTSSPEAQRLLNEVISAGKRYTEIGGREITKIEQQQRSSTDSLWGNPSSQSSAAADGGESLLFGNPNAAEDRRRVAFLRGTVASPAATVDDRRNAKYDSLMNSPPPPVKARPAPAYRRFSRRARNRVTFSR